MFLLSWIGQRGMEATGQMKMMAYAMPVVFTFLFLNFPSGLNLYYASMNFASLPQQLYLSRERKEAKQVGPDTDTATIADSPAGPEKPKVKKGPKKQPKKQPKKKQSKAKKRGA